jgi:predicted metal-dependent hydrolase
MIGGTDGGVLGGYGGGDRRLALLENGEGIIRKEAMKNIAHPGYRQHLSNMMANQKIIDLIAKKIVK